MRIKHFAGYGCVDAKKVSLKTAASGVKTLVVEVVGNHERGLERDDEYDLFNWLVKRFDKTAKDYRKIRNYKMEDTYIQLNGLDVEKCTYTFTIDP